MNESLVYLLVFHAYVSEITVQEAKSPVKSLSGSVARRDLIPALKGKWHGTAFWDDQDISYEIWCSYSDIDYVTPCRLVNSCDSVNGYKYLSIYIVSVLERIVLEEIPCLKYWYVQSQLNPINILEQDLFMIYFSIVLHNLHLGDWNYPFHVTRLIFCIHFPFNVYYICVLFFLAFFFPSL
jgi:hypothetical protein